MIKDDRSFGQRLRATRVGAGLSQSELEALSGIPKARLSRYENGHVVPSIQTLERLAKALRVSEATLLGDQRAVLEEFFKVLESRGIGIRTPEQASRLARALADIAEILAPASGDSPLPSLRGAETPAPVTSTGGWIGAESTSGEPEPIIIDR